MSGQFGPTRASDNIRPPVAGEVTVLDVTTSAVETAIPDSWRFRYLTIQAETTDVYVLFGPAGVVANGASTSGNTQSVLIPATGSLECYIPGATDPSVQAFSVVGTGSGKVRCWPSSPAEGGSP
jgi:hypothetical protein